MCVSYTGTGIESSCEDLHDIHGISEVTLESLLLSVTPEIPKLDECLVLYNLVASGYIDDNREGWASTVDSPASDSLGDGHTLKLLREIFGQVLSAANITDPLVEVKINGLKTLDSEPTVSLRPGAYLQLSTPSFNKPDPDRDHWADVIMPIEFGRRSGDAGCYTGLRTVVWQMHYIMRSDPRRRFVFGLTIENTSARFWFHDRCDIVASEIFDIQKDWKTLACLFLRLASASFEDLGYDSRCKAVKTELYSYDFIFENVEDGKPFETVYRTVDVISDLGASNLLGHGTRVWKVQKVIEGPLGEDVYALKDVWPYDDCEPEHLVVRKIREAQPEYAMHFLTIVDAQFVPTLKDGQRTSDHTLDVIRRGRDLLATAVELSTGIPSETTPRGHHDLRPLRHYPRRHYRMVSREVGTSVYDMRHFANALRAIQGASKGLYAMHLINFNHRDVSAGNIIYYQGADEYGARGIIMDLEYAKEHSTASNSHDDKTGTAEFMAVEVSYGKYVHEPIPVEINEAGEIVTMSPPPFRQNALHDYESVWWITIWLLFTLFEPKRVRTGEHISNYEKVFKSSAHVRLAFWDRVYEFQSLSRHLVSPPEKRYLAKIRLWAKELQALYEKSYLAKEYQVLSPETVKSAHQLGLKWLEELIVTVSPYPDNLVFLSELNFAPPTPELSIASLNLGPGHDPSTVHVESHPT